MFFQYFEAKNYKSFENTGKIEFDKNINIIIGQNNVGKTALLEALQLKATGKPHKSLKTAANRPPKQKSTFQFCFEINNDEIKSVASKHDELYVHMPSPAQQYSNLLIDLLNNQESFKIFASQSSQIDSIGGIEVSPKETGTELFGISPSTWENFSIGLNKEKDQFEDISSPPKKQLFHLASGYFQSKIFRFNAERMKISESAIQNTLKLAPDAGNLPGAMLQLMGVKQPLFNKLCETAQQIIPSVKGIAPRINDRNNAELRIWRTDPNSGRDDLQTPLSECGTGISQVLALLYVVLTSTEQHVILIDEPNSFLHPGAAKKLIKVFRKHPRHQYIICTHSPDIIKASRANNILHITQENGISQIYKLDTQKVEETRRLMADLGASFTDLMAADKILWVEGETEQECLRLIVDQLCDFPIGISIVAVRSTSFTDAKKDAVAAELMETHQNACKAGVPVATTLGYLFDRENRTKQQRNKLQDKAKGAKIEFLDRMMFENYLLNPECIAYALNSLAPFKDTPISARDVQSWLESNGLKEKYIRKKLEIENIGDEKWIANVHAGKLLKDLFYEIKDAKAVHHKVRDGATMTQWLLENAPTAFDEILKKIKRLLDTE